MATYNYGKSTTKLTATEAIAVVLQWSVFLVIGIIVGVLMLALVTGVVAGDASEPAVIQPAAVATQ